MISAINTYDGKNNKTQHIGFLLQPNFTMMALSSALEPLRMANQLSGKILYTWTMISEDGDAVAASDGLSVNVDCSIDKQSLYDVVLVCAGIAVKDSITKANLSWLNYLSRHKVTLGGICTGSYLLAKAGLLDGITCTIHWELLAGWQEDFPHIKSTNQLFTIDGNRWCSSGGTAPMDLMLCLIGKAHGKALQIAICEMFSHEHVRDESEMQRIPLQHVIGANQSKLQEIVHLMEANIEEILSLDELACYVTLSRRQLERLFQRYLHCSPHRYYLQIRLTRARQLIKQTNMSIIEVAICCGFVSTPHFSKCYRNTFNMPPRDERVNRGLKFGAAKASGESTFGSILCTS
jgi:transcriptional regulator GlxA family with amidase domain